MPLPPVEQEAPHFNPTAQSIHILLFLSFRSEYLLISRLICQERKREKLMSVMCSKDVLKKRDMYMCMHKLITVRMRGERV